MKQQIESCVGGRLSWSPFLLFLVFAVPFINTASIYGQESAVNSGLPPYTEKKNDLQTPESGPFLKEYRKVTIGMPGEVLREIWGKPVMEDSDGFLYKISESETVQVVVGPEKKITAISVTFLKGEGAPAFTDVFGQNAVPVKSENGSVYRMVRYKDAGYWVAYSAGPADDASVSVTMQKF